MKKLLVVATAVAVMVAGCGGNTSGDSNEAKATPLVVVVDPNPELCQPPGVSGNCWVPLWYPPVISGSGALNQNATCNNESRDQSSCWPQPGTELQAVCIQAGADQRPWYGFDIPRERVFKESLTGWQPGQDLVRAFASVQLFAIKDITSDALGALPAC